MPEKVVMTRFALTAALVLSVAACAAPRPRPILSCSLSSLPVPSPAPAPAPVPKPAPLPPNQTEAVSAAPGAVRPPRPEIRLLQDRIRESFLNRQELKRARLAPPVSKPLPPGVKPPPPQPPPPPTWDVLVLSAGGQLGAYGAGFLQGWGERSDLSPNRGDIDMITGVSTGAMMATYVYLGSSSSPAVRSRYDALLKALYTTLRDEDVVRKREGIEFLWANSIYDTAPLRERVTGLITGELLDALVEEADRSHRLLFVGAVDADSGRFEYFDLVAMARDTANPERRACYAAAVLASAAIPGAFSPVFINDRMYIDGGARRYAFFLEQAAAGLPPGVQKNAFGIMHVDPGVEDERTKNHLIGVVARTVEISKDQLTGESAYHVDAEARGLGYRARWTAARDTGCAEPRGVLFDPTFGSCLWDVGHRKAVQDASPWKDLDQAFAP